MIRVETRPRRLAVGGVEPVVLEVWPGALLWQAAKAFALAEAKRRAQERVARRRARRLA